MLGSTPALSVRQPWAELIVSGRKTVEVRSWTTEYRGKLWLHAGKASDPSLEKAFGLTDPFRGGFVGSVLLSATVPLDSERWELWRARHLVSANYLPGHFGWILERPIRFRSPVPAPGRLNLFQPGTDLERLLNQAEEFAIGEPRSSE
jgi:hypothetical protein